MKNATVFCLTLDPEHEDIIKKLSFTPVGLGNKKFSKNCFTDKSGKNISIKNPFYGEYTFHYWLWKNYLKKINSEWVGFCQYRKFFVKNYINTKNITLDELKEELFLEFENKENYECILGNKFSVENYKFSKIIKHHLYYFLNNPTLFFNKKKRNLKLQFDLFHGRKNLDKAIDLLDEINKKDFKTFMNTKNSFNPHNMFFCKTKLLENYYKSVFPWLERCEEIFGFYNLTGYGSQRIYGFLAERFLSYWFTKNLKVKELPIVGKDLSSYKYL